VNSNSLLVRPPEAEILAVINEPGRVAVLGRTGLMDSATESAFDRFTRLASKLINADIALFSVVDGQRQFFKSATGALAAADALRQTPLSHSFCRIVVATGQPLVVTDATSDPRVADNGAVADLGVIAYLGAPVTLAGGFCLGSLCVLDSVPREWTPRDQEVLAELAELVVTEVTLRLEIQERKDAQEQLEQARDAALAASRTKSEFLTNMSHELRTPMNAIIGFSGLLGVSVESEEHRDWANTIEGAGTHLLALLSSILDLAKLEAGPIEFEAAPVQLAELLRDAVRLCEGTATGKGLVLTHRVTDGLPTAVFGDAVRLRQILVNLLGNAIKFTAQGGVSVTLDAVRDDDRWALDLAVTDTGIGIAPEVMDRLFQKFVQADGSIARRYGGTGLGLAISRQLAEQMGGTLTAESDLGAGSTFRFRWTAHEAGNLRAG